MDREAMSNEENYAFDIAGYLHVSGVLTRGEVEALNKAVDEAGRIEGMLGWEDGLREPGTGASGEIRSAVPNKYLSSITSPATRTLAAEKSGIKSVTTRVYYSHCVEVTLSRKPTHSQAATDSGVLVETRT